MEKVRERILNTIQLQIRQEVGEEVEKYTNNASSFFIYWTVFQKVELEVHQRIALQLQSKFNNL